MYAGIRRNENSRITCMPVFTPAVHRPAIRGAHRIFSRGVIGGGRGQWLGGTMASAEHEPITGVWGQSPKRGPGAQPLVWGSGGRSAPEAESILFIGCPTEPANLAPVRENSRPMLCYGPQVPELGGPECMVHTVSKYSYKSDASAVST